MTRITYPEWPVLIIDDEIQALESTESALISARINHLIILTTAFWASHISACPLLIVV